MNLKHGIIKKYNIYFNKSVKKVVANVLSSIDSKEFLDFFSYVYTLFVPKKGGLLSIDYTIGYLTIFFGSKYKLTNEFTEFLEVL